MTTVNLSNPRRFSLKFTEEQLILPLAGFLIAFYIMPLIVLLARSFQAQPNTASFSVEQYLRFFQDPVNLDIWRYSLSLGFWCTLICLLLGYPLAYIYIRAENRWQTILTFLIMLPLLTSIVVRTFAWIVILGREGLINSFLRAIGMIDQPLSLLFTHTGVVIALSQIMLPFMVLPLTAAMIRVDMRLMDASISLGAGAWRTFLWVFVPLTLPGIISGCLLVFAISISAFVTPSIIGGGRVLYMPNIIYQQSILLLDWNFAAAISVVLLVTVIAVVIGLSVLNRISRSYVHS
ncbi:ABC transporter permease [Leptolyngbya sp. NK1-12]|uniref:ABC transporter permease n=1 Tax=Leptolyngbya sp. NK1-12 TaxID=2547451 RepID=A0AA96WFK3_9CYAN|nr:ABC transporter permease [Leptolyngbya sp. NK1-12]WNZ24129.1 ABC transporter permease [Leptolyngbya sp. NK1-12]